MKKSVLSGCLMASIVFGAAFKPVEAKPRRATKAHSSAKGAAKDEAAMMKALAQFLGALKSGDSKRIVAFFSPAGVQLFNPVKDRRGETDKMSFVEAAAEFDRDGEWYRALVQSKVRTATGETEPALVALAQLNGAQWQRSGNRLVVRGAKAGSALKDVAFGWEKRGAQWRLNEIDLPIPIFG